jgi:alpha-beta hydrolase superfamily lysophospholipase
MTTTTALTTQFTTSADGTRIAYEVRGRGPALVSVDGALCQRVMGPSRGLAEALAEHFTVHVYDRRGRGESGPGRWPDDLDAEVADLRAVVDAAGGHAHVLGVSSGAVLALEAVRQGAPVDRLAAYEAPFIVDGSQAPNDPQLPERLHELAQSGRRGDAVRLFLRTVGMPAAMVPLMRLMPPWKHMVGIAHTLAFDLSLVIAHQQGRPLPEGHYAGVASETLVLAGGKSPAAMQNAQAAVAAAVPHGRLVTLPGQTHMVKPAVVAAAVTPFLLGH